MIFKRTHEDAVKKFESTTKSHSITPEGPASAYNKISLIKEFDLEKHDEAFQLIGKAVSIQDIKELGHNKAELLQEM